MLNLKKYAPMQENQWFTIAVDTPWEGAGQCSYMFPEFAYIAMSEFRLLSYSGPRPPYPPHMLPVQFPELEFTDGGKKAGYSLRYDAGVKVEARMEVVGPNVVEMTLTLQNDSEQYFPAIDFTNCLNLTGMGPEYASIRSDLKLFWSEQGLASFNDVHYRDGRPLTSEDKQYVMLHVKGTPEYIATWANGGWYDRTGIRKREEALMPFLARKAESCDRYVATCWPSASTLLSNSGLACMHSDVTLPNCPSGAVTQLHGCILFHEGDQASFIERICALNRRLASHDLVPEPWSTSLE